MALKISKADTWVAGIKDEPGGLAGKLEVLKAGGANLEFVVARRSPDKPGTGVVFVTPIRGAKQVRAAKKAGFARSSSLHTVRIQGPDKRGMGACLTGALAEAGINLRGLSAGVVGKQFIMHLAFDTAGAAAKAVRVLKAL
ncbi:MAG: amino acid-binding protein [Phycisphaerae bacterium]